MSTERFFRPFVGKHYGTSLLGKRVLVVGASHYCSHYEVTLGCGWNGHCPHQSETCQRMTNDVIGWIMDGYTGEGWTTTYNKFFNSFFLATPTPQRRAELIDTMAFMNYLQQVEGHDANEKNNSLFWEPSHFVALEECVKSLRPDLLITWGNRVWDALKYHLRERGALSPHASGESDILSARFGTREIPVVGLYHPSSSKLYYNDPQRLYNIVGIKLL